MFLHTLLKRLLRRRNRKKNKRNKAKKEGTSKRGKEKGSDITPFFMGKQENCLRLFGFHISKNPPNMVGNDLIIWQGQKDLNPQPTDLESATLPIELYPCILRYLL
jgi:hypothetical protein